MQGAQILQILNKGLVAAGVSFGGWIIMFPLRTLFKTIKEKSQVLDDVKNELITQRTNCLSTLQEQGERQIELLGQVNDTLQDIHLGQSEMSGYLKGQGAEPRPTKRKRD